ncbi:WD40 repeat-like protein [Saccharata proteae CBS 121410]|uniref:WD40 repeat-like protein n=1 Tax=Saccharata proteae CBS 121410 TaxID=1314787 RepID=A0A9P4HYU9_9PEZI|nr:WD40 repeat-like protein [Saccharata proteae CBS 121410]
MSLTPSHHGPAGLRLMPSNPAFSKNSLKSPNRPNRPDIALSLRQVIGSTANSANAFDSLPSQKTFAFTAGAAAVVATITEDQQVTQRFLRARPTAASINPAASSLRDSNSTASPYASPAANHTDSPSNRSWSAKDRIKAATCVSFSADGKYLAIGETGYRPRVLIFSTAPNAPSDTPLTSISDHTFGVQCVAFSPDSQYLASLGAPNDGFLYIWSINPRTGSAQLHASNKCTNHVNKIAWLGNSLIAVGTRHCKVWRVDDANANHSKTRPSDVASPFNNRTLPGRNCLLGSLLEANFTSVVPVTPTKAIISSDRGHICLLDDSDKSQKFYMVAHAKFPVTSMAADSNGLLHISGFNGDMTSMSIAELIAAKSPPASPTGSNSSHRSDSPSGGLVYGDATYMIAMGTICDLLVTLDSRHAIRLMKLGGSTGDSCSRTLLQQLPAHGEAVMGVRPVSSPNMFNASFYTWSAGGTVLFWSQDGANKGRLQVPVDQLADGSDEPNELRVARVSSNAAFLVSGDRYGVLRVLDCQTTSVIYEFRAHSSEVTDLAIHEGKQTFIASSGRDRTVQVFQKTDSWSLLQTLDEHVGAVTGLLFTSDGQRLVSASSDRTIVVRDYASRDEDGKTVMAYLILRTITLKATASSLILDADRDDTVLVSTIDRHVHRYDLASGQAIKSFKTSDFDGGDAVAMTSIAHIITSKGACLVGGVASTDKSIRLYEDTGCLIARDWGHTEGVTDIAVVTGTDDKADPDQKCLVTVALDGTIFIWNLDSKPAQNYDISKSLDLMGVSTPNTNLLVNKPPLRRVLSQGELARFQKEKPADDDDATPTRNRSPTLRKKVSKATLTHTPKLEPSPMTGHGGHREHALRSQSSRRSLRNRSSSPSSPKSHHLASSRRPSIADSRAKPRAAGHVRQSSLGSSTEQLCRSLRAYRKKLSTTSESVSTEASRELERELGLTARALADRAKRAQPVDESVMVRLLDQYSERLVEMMDEKIGAAVARQVRQNSDCGRGFETSGLEDRPYTSGSSRPSSKDDAVAGREDLDTASEGL